MKTISTLRGRVSSMIHDISFLQIIHDFATAIEAITNTQFMC